MGLSNVCSDLGSRFEKIIFLLTGYYCPTGSNNSSVFKCAGGFYGASSGQTNEFCSGACLPGYFCPIGSTSATSNDCPYGYFCPLNTTLPFSCSDSVECPSKSNSSFGIGIRPDNTSLFYCSNSTVIYDTIVTCYLFPRKSSQSINVVSNSSFFSLITDSSKLFVTNLTPLDLYIYGSHGYSFNVTSSITVAPGLYPLSYSVLGVAAAPSLYLFVTGISNFVDNSTLFSCFPLLLSTGSSCSCQLVPRIAGVQVFTSSAAFMMSSNNDGVFSTFSSMFNNSFVVVFTAGNMTGSFIISNGRSNFSVQIQVYAFPDSTSFLNCSNGIVSLHTTMDCNFVPRVNGLNIFTLNSTFSLTEIVKFIVPNYGIVGKVTILHIEPFFSSIFNFTYVTANVSGVYELSTTIDNFRNFVIQNYEIPDSSSIILCSEVASTFLLANCTIYPKKEFIPIFTLVYFFLFNLFNTRALFLISQLQ